MAEGSMAAVDVVTIGAATLDVFFQSSQFQLVEKDGSVALCERFNEKIDVEHAGLASGGAATNVAVGLARLGFAVECIAEIGKDAAGSIVRKELTDEKVSTARIVQVEGEETALSGLLISKDGARTALVHRGAARMLTHNDINWSTLSPKWLHLSSIGNLELISAVFAHCAKYNIALSWNPGNWEIDQVRQGLLKPDWRAVHMLFVNREEMGALMGQNLADEAVWKSDWCFVGPKVSIVTDGRNGGRFCMDGVCRRFSPETSAVVQETGAGDAFASGVIAATLKGKSLEEAVALGAKNAAAVVAHMGAKKGLLRALPAL